MPNKPGVPHRLCFLHVGKTGGTAIRSVIEQHNGRASPAARLEVFTHEMTLPELCSIRPDGRIIFFVRDPIERFVSGFNSRLRYGRPRYNVPWTPREEAAFQRFPTANALGEALSSHASDREAAKNAMQAIYHARLSFVHYLQSIETLENNQNNIAFIGSTESFDTDLDIMKGLAGINSEIQAPTDAVGAHRNPSNLDRSLSEVASKNLRQWYADDYSIYHWCLVRRRTLLDDLKHRAKWART